MSAISTTGARIVRSANARPARRRHLRPVGALKVKRSSQYLCSEASITFGCWLRVGKDLDRFFSLKNHDAF